MTSANVVFMSPAHETNPIRREKPIETGATLYGGNLVEDNGSGEWQAASTDGQGGDINILDLNGAKQLGLTDAWTVGDDAQAFVPQTGYSYNLVLAASQVITDGEALTSNGAGAVKTCATDGTEAALFIAEEAVTTTGATGRIRARYQPGSFAAII